MEKNIVTTAAILGMTAIILGAFGAHLLKESLDALQLTGFETGVRYQMYHALFLLFIGMTPIVSQAAKKRIYWLALIGTVLFSGSIYLLTTVNLTGIDIGGFGIVTPVGGTLLIIAWLLLFIDIIRN